MEKKELRELVIDFIIVCLYPKGEMVNNDDIARKAKAEYGNGFSDKGWNGFYDSLIADMTSSANEVILIKQDKNLIGLSDLGRLMGESGGYIRYKTQQKVKKTVEKGLLATYYISAIIAALVAADILHFSKSHEVPVPSVWFVLSWVIIGGILRDAIQRLPRLIARLFPRKG